MENWIESQDRHGVTIRGERVLHSVAARDWYCECGYKVVTRWFEDEPHWRSVCPDNERHDPDGFIHTGSIPYVQFQVAQEEARAQEVLRHLPTELQEIVKGE